MIWIVLILLSKKGLNALNNNFVKQYDQKDKTYAIENISCNMARTEPNLRCYYMLLPNLDNYMRALGGLHFNIYIRSYI